MLKKGSGFTYPDALCNQDNNQEIVKSGIRFGRGAAKAVAKGSVTGCYAYGEEETTADEQEAGWVVQQCAPTQLGLRTPTLPNPRASARGK